MRLNIDLVSLVIVKLIGIIVEAVELEQSLLDYCQIE